MACLAMKESRPTQVLRYEVKQVAKKQSFDSLSIDSHESVPDFKTFCRTSLLLPTKLFFTEPIVLLTSVMAATVYALIYLLPEAFAIVYTGDYGFTPRQSSLVNLSLLVGIVFTVLPRLRDISISNKLRRENMVEEPEDKLFGFLIAAPILAIGLWWFAWTVPPLGEGLSTWISIASLALIGFATVEFDTVLSGYLTDTYTSYAASANAPMAFLRAILSGIFPLFGHQMFAGLKPNNATFLLAGVATAFCGVAVLFAKYGKRIRQRSRFAEESWLAQLQSQGPILDDGRLVAASRC